MSRFFEEMARLAAQRGMRAEEKEDGLNLEMDGTRLCKVMEDGSLRYQKSDMNSPAWNRLLHGVMEDAQTAREYVSAMDTAPFLKAAGLTDEKFKLLLDYGSYVLAGQDRGRHGFQFVTWEWSYDHTGVGTGNYWESNYQCAKEDFAVRSGLVNRDRLFDQEQSMALYRLVRHRLVEAIPDKPEKDRLHECQRKMERSYTELERIYSIEKLAADLRTGYTLIEPRRKTCYATGLYDEASGTYLSEANPEKFPDAKPFESPYDGLAKLCQEKIHLRDYEQTWDYPLVLRELPDADALAGRLDWNYGANTGFLVEGLAFVKAISEADEWLLCKQEDGVWQALDHVSLHQLLKQRGEDYFGKWIEAVRHCPTGGYPEQLTIPEITAPTQEGPTM